MSNLIEGREYVGPAAMGCVFLLLLALESLLPLRRAKHAKMRRLFINLCFSAFAFVVGVSVVRPVALGLATWTSERPFGLLQVVAVPSAIHFVAGFLLMDLTFYYWHRANHVIRLLWRFHNVHHLDPDLDVSTSFRFHFVEILYSTGFRALQVGALGIGPATYVTYEFFFQLATMFHHSNINLPIRAERWLNKLIVTPRMHGVHHSIVRDETNSNYSVIFRWWDMLNRSLRLGIRQSHIDIGVAGYRQPEDNRFLGLLELPFRKQREYWRLPDGSYPARMGDAEAAGANILLE
jgi:sterol desaturase/sphingolipid hydroxylase (fatty acid hydroxylase superfamily)